MYGLHAYVDSLVELMCYDQVDIPSEKVPKAETPVACRPSIRLVLRPNFAHASLKNYVFMGNSRPIERVQLSLLA
jgi:hypothetical protein